MAKFKNLFEKIDPNSDSRYDELDTSGYSPTQQMQGEGIGNLIKGMIGDTAPAQGDEGIRESMSPIDLVTPGMVAAPVKALGRGAMSIGRDVAEALPRYMANETGSIGQWVKPANMDMSPEAVKARWIKAMADENMPNYKMEKDPSFLDHTKSDYQEKYDAIKGKNSEIKNPSNTEQSLPMDQASRMARAKEMGHTTNAYHGTTGDFHQFDPKFGGMQTGAAPSAKDAFWFSEKPEIAEAYAANAQPREITNASINNLPDQEFDKIMNKHLNSNPMGLNDNSTMDQVKFGQDSNIMPVKLKMENPFIHSEPVDFSNDQSINEIVQKAKQQGHGSIHFNNVLGSKGEGPQGSVYGVFNPSNVRSVNAEFDPSKAGSSNILAGLGGATAAASQLQDEDKFQQLKKYLGK